MYTLKEIDYSARVQSSNENLQDRYSKSTLPSSQMAVQTKTSDALPSHLKSHKHKKKKN